MSNLLEAQPDVRPSRVSSHVNAMRNDCTYNVVQLLQATLSILENEEFRAKDSKAIADLKECLDRAIAEVETAKAQAPVR